MKPKVKLALIIFAVVTVATFNYIQRPQNTTQTLNDVLSTDKITADSKQLGLVPPTTNLKFSQDDFPQELLTPANQVKLSGLLKQMSTVDAFLESKNALEALSNPNLDEHFRNELLDAVILKQKLLVEISEIQIAASAKLLAEINK